VTATLLLLAGALGCRRAQHHPPRATAPPGALPITAALAQVPAETATFFFLDFDRARGQAAWNPLLAGLVRSFGPVLEGVSAGTGFEPTRNVHRLWFALPGEPDGRFALLADTDTLDEARLTAWLRARTGDSLAAFVRNHNQIVVGAGAWKTLMAGLARDDRLSPSAVDNPELRRLCERVARDHGVWFASLVSPKIRRALMEEGRFPEAASLARVSGHIDLEAGLHLGLVGELTNTRDGAQVAHRLLVYLNQAKRDPEMLVSGLSPYLEAVRIQAQDATVRVSLDVPSVQAADLVERMEALAHQARTK